jgi:hypothetical protein
MKAEAIATIHDKETESPFVLAHDENTDVGSGGGFVGIIAGGDYRSSEYGKGFYGAMMIKC